MWVSRTEGFIGWRKKFWGRRFHPQLNSFAVSKWLIPKEADMLLFSGISRILSVQ